MGTNDVMGPDDSWQVIEEHRLALADLLAALDADQWETPSLCVGWRVRDVAAHVSMGAHVIPVRTMLREAARARGNFDRMNHDLAVASAERSPDAIVDDLRQHAGSRRLPPVTNYRNVLFDVLVHGQDIAVPLDVPLAFPLSAGPTAATTLWQLTWPWCPRRMFRGLAFTATDVVWSAGQGTEVRGPIRAVILALAGRPAALTDLTGPGLPELSARLAPGPRLQQQSRRRSDP